MAGLALDIPSRKITHHLLALGALDPSKAVFFLGRGFTLTGRPVLSDALAEHAVGNRPGTVRPGETVASFTTAYPA